MSPDDLMLEKQSVLLELERLKAQGLTLSKQYTVDDNLADMQFEIRRHMMHIDELNSISFMKDGLRLVFTGIETANRSLGPFLELDGWGASASAELSTHKYDATLSKLFRKYWRQGGSSPPEMELAMAVLGSMGSYHFKNKFFSSSGKRHAPSIPIVQDDSDDDEEAP